VSVVTGSYLSTLTPLQLIAGAGLLQNTGLRVNPRVTSSLAAYNTTPVVAGWFAVVNAMGALSASNQTAIKNLGSPTCPALSNSIPQLYLNLGTFSTLAGYPYPYPGLSGIVQTKANLYLGSPTGAATNWDMSRAAQLLLTCDAYAQVANQFIFSACNTQGDNNYMCDTFTDMNNAFTGDFTLINLATPDFGQDLQNLGYAINLENLDDLGSPLALARQIIASVPGTVPLLSVAFILYGVPEDIVLSFADPKTSVNDSAQKLMFKAMQNIVGDDLKQILQVLEVKTAGLTTLADLLNPLKMFPLSYKSLTVPTANGPRLLYQTPQGDVNTTLLQELPTYVISSIV